MRIELNQIGEINCSIFYFFYIEQPIASYLCAHPYTRQLREILTGGSTQCSHSSARKVQWNLTYPNLKYLAAQVIRL